MTDKEKWNNFIKENNGSFLQSFQWGEFQKSLGRKIFRIEIENNLRALIIKHDLPFKKSFLYCPRGPVIKNLKGFGEFVQKIKKIALEENAIFFKIEPDFDFDFDNISDFGFRKSFREIQPSKTLSLDISKPEEELLSKMHCKTRYNIRLAERRGVVVKISDSCNYFNDFFALLEKSAKRDDFRTHPKQYYKKQLLINDDEYRTFLFIAYHKNIPIAGIMVNFFGLTATYLHGGFDYSFRSLMAPYKLQYEAIRRAKTMGCKYYDFWGIEEKRWPGVTRFKKGFGGKKVVYPGSFDLILSRNWYIIYKVSRKILI